MAISIRNVRLLCPSTGRDQIINASLPGTDETLDASGLWLMPGAIDLAARKVTLASETHAALHSGITTVIAPPDSRPVADSPAVIDRIHAKALAAQASKVRVLGALTVGLAGDALAEYSALKTAGIVGLSNGLAPLGNMLVALRALQYAHGLGLTVHVVPLDAALANKGVVHEGATATRLGLAGIPVAAEISAVRAWISLVEDTGAPLHFGRISSARACDLIAAAQKRGMPITADVAAHQLLLTDAALEGYNANAHVRPPLRSEDDRLALRAALASGVICALCSDHQPHQPDAKINPFPLTEPGISALETLLPIGLGLVQDGLLSPLQLAARLSQGPAAVLGLPAPALGANLQGDWILVNPNLPWQLSASSMLSSGKNSPFIGQRFTGKCIRAFLQA